jgi:hypothetical protein
VYTCICVYGVLYVNLCVYIPRVYACMYTRVYVCMCICMCVYMCECMYVCMYVCIGGGMYVCVGVYGWACMCVQAFAWRSSAKDAYCRWSTYVFYCSTWAQPRRRLAGTIHLLDSARAWAWLSACRLSLGHPRLRTRTVGDRRMSSIAVHGHNRDDDWLARSTNCTLYDGGLA